MRCLWRVIRVICKLGGIFLDVARAVTATGGGLRDPHPIPELPENRHLSEPPTSLESFAQQFLLHTQPRHHYPGRQHKKQRSKRRFYLVCPSAPFSRSCSQHDFSPREPHRDVKTQRNSTILCQARSYIPWVGV